MDTSTSRQTFRETVAEVAERARAILPPAVNGRIESAVHKAPCGRTRRGDRQGPSPPSPIKTNCLNLKQKKCKFLYDQANALRAD
jgi:hypothetical protein